MTALKEMTLIFLSSVVAGVVSLVMFLLIYSGVQSIPFVGAILSTMPEINSSSLEGTEYLFMLAWFLLGAACAAIFIGVNCLIVLLKRFGVMV